MSTDHPERDATGSEHFTENVSCAVCGSNQVSVLAPASYPPGMTKEELLRIYRASTDERLMDRLVQCTSCGLVYLSPRVRRELILEGYAGAEDPTFVAQNEMRIRTFRRVMSKLVENLSLAPDGMTVLDVGCGGGAFPKAAAGLGFRVVGIEASRWLSEFARRTYGLDIRQGTLEEQNLESGSFDVITIWDVLEHVPDPVRLLNECRRVIKEQGLLVISYPDYASLSRKILGLRWPFFHSGHLYYFTPESLGRLMDRCGFDILTTEPYRPELELSYVLRRASATRAMSRLSEGIKRTRIGGLPLRYSMGQTLLVARHRGSWS